MLTLITKADYYGRRWGMGVGCALTILATFIQTFAPRGQVGVFILGRVIIGAGQGLAISMYLPKLGFMTLIADVRLMHLAAGPIYIGEVTAPKIRGQVMTFWQLFYSVGSFMAYWINYATAHNRDKLGDWDWKIVVIFQILLPLVICVQLPFIPESPRWHIHRHGDTEGARKALTLVRSSLEEVETEILAIREVVEYEKEAQSSGWKTYLNLVRDPSIRKRLLIGFAINIGQQLTGQGTLNSYSSTIYAKVFESVGKLFSWQN